MDQRPQIDHELLLAQAGWVRGLAATLVRDPVGAEDLAQETLLAALARPPDAAHDERRLRAWLARVVTNLSRLAVRGNARRRGREELAARSERVPSAHETVERAAQLKRVVDAALELEEPYRSTVLLRFFEGLDSAEIGRRTGAAPAAVRKRLSRGLERLRERLDDGAEGDRQAWRLALLPLLRVDPAAAPAPGVELEALLEPTVQASSWTGAQAAAGWLAVLTLSGSSVFVGATLSGPDSGGLAASPGPPAEAQALAPSAAAGRRPVDGDTAVRRQTSERRASPAPPSPLEGPREDEPAGPAASERAVLAPALPAERAARVVDLDGTPLGGVALVEVEAGAGARVPLGWTGLDGRLVLDGLDVESGADPAEALRGERAGSAARSCWIAARATGLATVREGLLRAPEPGTAPAEGLVVATRAIEAAGVVLDPYGRPVAGARLVLEVPDEAYVDLRERLEGTRPARHATDTDASGRFRFDALPSASALELHVSADGLGSLRVPVPAWSRPDWVLRFDGAPPVRLVEGLVRLPDGTPAEGARVRAGAVSARTDRGGRYRLELSAERAPVHLLAELDGWQPGSGGLAGGRGQGRPGGVGPGALVVSAAPIELPGPLLSIPGTAVGPDGEPAEGWEVLAIDEGLDPRHPTRPPGAVAARTVSGPGGAFVLLGLLDRPYRVVALDPQGGAQAGPERLQAGARATLRARADRAGGGRVTAPGGAPLSGALVSAARPTEQGPVAVGTAVVAGADGSFELLPVPGAVGGMWLAGTGEEAGVALAFGASVELPREAWFRYAGCSAEPGPDALGVLDGEGRPLLLHPPSGPAERVRLARGRGPVVRTDETAAALVLYREGVEQGRLPLALAPGELTVVTGPAGGVTALAAPAGGPSTAFTPPGTAGSPSAAAAAAPGGTGRAAGAENPEPGVTSGAPRQP